MIPQVSGTLGERLDAAFMMVGAPALLVGMDTPQLEPSDLDAAISALGDPSCDVVLGPAVDGGYWAIGFARSVRGAFAGVPMSTAQTFGAAPSTSGSPRSGSGRPFCPSCATSTTTAMRWL